VSVRALAATAAVTACLIATLAHAHSALSTPDQIFTQGLFTPTYTPPAPGTYELPPIRHVRSFTLVDTAGRRVTTAALARGRVTVVSFIYTGCSDRLGCPLASAALRDLQERLRRAGLTRRAALLSISVDPGRDSPAQLAQYARAFGADATVWRFLTADSDAHIQPVLDAYGQDRQRVHDERGRFTGAYRHVLKVFLVDRHGWIRNIYSTGLLVPAVVVNDIATLLGEPPETTR
jgi:cytochrome oxidase Cu insertion factor (SCO1/SenC/PrrC family)